MGGCQSNDADIERRAREEKNKYIEKGLSRDSRYIAEEVKVLLLGPGESGKSTIFKQMKILQQGGGFTKEELLSYKQAVCGNLLTQMKIVISAAKELKISLNDPQSQEHADNIMRLFPTNFTPEAAEDLKKLWKDEGIQETYSLRDRRYQLNDSAGYFFENIERLTADDYVPTIEDVLRTRVRTTGVISAVYEFDEIFFRIVDVGGQRAERRKWIHCFDNVSAVLFCVNLAEYDLTLREDPSQKRMKESLLLWDEICNSPYFSNTAFILFLNKKDLFEEKIKRVDLKVCFPNYKGGGDFETAAGFIKKQFLDHSNAPHLVFPHYTCAIDTNHLRIIWEAVRQTLLGQIFNDIF